MNVISSFSSEAPFIISIISAAGGKLNEDKVDVWLLNCIANSVMHSFLDAVGDRHKLALHVKRQLIADMGKSYLSNVSYGFRN